MIRGWVDDNINFRQRCAGARQRRQALRPGRTGPHDGRGTADLLDMRTALQMRRDI